MEKILILLATISLLFSCKHEEIKECKHVADLSNNRNDSIFGYIYYSNNTTVRLSGEGYIGEEIKEKKGKDKVLIGKNARFLTTGQHNIYLGCPILESEKIK